MVWKNFYVETSKCVLCQNESNEYLMHLFFECEFRQSFWWALNLEWDTNMSL
jgi:hypothetical protein